MAKIIGEPFSYNTAITTANETILIQSSGYTAIITAIIVNRLLDNTASLKHYDSASVTCELLPYVNYPFSSSDSKRIIKGIILDKNSKITIDSDTANALRVHVQGFWLTDNINDEVIPPDTQLSARYTFDDRSGSTFGSTFYDAIGTNHGTNYGGVFKPIWFGDGLDFRGKLGRGEIATSPNFSISTTGELAIAMPVLFGSDVTTKGGILCKNNDTLYEWGVQVESGYVWAIIWNSTGGTVRKEKAAIQANKMYFLVVNFTGKTHLDEIEIYLNNEKVKVFSSSNSSNTYTATAAPVRIAFAQTSTTLYPADIAVDDIWILQRVITAGERDALYNKFVNRG